MTKIKKWTALLATVSGMAALMMTVQTAAGSVLNVTATGTTFDHDSSYSAVNVSGQGALTVNGTGVVYSGTRINLESDFPYTSGVHAINGGEVIITGGTIRTSAIGSGARVVGGTMRLVGMDIITESVSSRGLNVNQGCMKVEQVSITTTGSGAFGAVSGNSGTLTVRNSIIKTTMASALVSDSDGHLEADNVTCIRNQDDGINSTIAYVRINSTMNIRGGSFMADNGDLFGSFGSGSNQLTLRDVQASGSRALIVQGTNTTLVMLHNSALTGNVAVSESTTTTLNLNTSTLIGDIIANDDAVLTVNLDNASELTGKIDPV
ncbi:MAG: hypothetical protein LBD30_00470, partial [Verrucomicrobiales bacterium]|nr:hypothetical protein [Verrucomicrobiales bacterium]